MNLKKFLLLALIASSQIVFSQEDYINDDGTVSNKYKRELILASIKEHETPENQYDIEGLSFVVIGKSELDPKDFKKNELQKNVLYSSFLQLLDRINALKNVGHTTLEDAGFESVIFKINTIIDFSTRRYHFKFSIQELENFPNYMDLKELIEYITSRNNKNIIHAKNPAVLN